MNDELKTKRRWYQFSLRTMFVLVALASVVFGLWVQRSREWIRQRHEALDNNRIWAIVVPEKKITAPGFLWVFGEDGFSDLGCNGDAPENFETLERLFPEATMTAVIVVPEGEGMSALSP